MFPTWSPGMVLCKFCSSSGFFGKRSWQIIIVLYQPQRLIWRLQSLFTISRLISTVECTRKTCEGGGFYIHTTRSEVANYTLLGGVMQVSAMSRSYPIVHESLVSVYAVLSKDAVVRDAHSGQVRCIRKGSWQTPVVQFQTSPNVKFLYRQLLIIVGVLPCAYVGM